MNHLNRRQLPLLAILLTGAIASCVVVDDSVLHQPSMIVEEHYTVEVDGQKIPAKDVHTESSRGPDGTIMIKRDETYYREGQRLLDRYLGEAGHAE